MLERAESVRTEREFEAKVIQPTGKNFESVCKTVLKLLPDEDRVQIDQMDLMEKLLTRIENRQRELE